MPKRTVSIGTAPNDGQGDPLRVAMVKINGNFDELYDYFGDGSSLVSYASTSGISTLSRNLTGSPRIDVSGILNTGITTTEHLEVRNITSTGIITAVQFIGDGSQLSNVTAAAGGIEVLDDNVRKGIARELNFGENIISSGPDGVGRVTISVGSSIVVSGIVTLAQGLIGSPNLNVGVVTATSFIGDGSGLTNLPVPSNNYAVIAGYSTVSGISTISGYATSSGISTYASISGYSTSSGISTTSITSGYATTSGIASVSQGITGTPNVTVGILTATSSVIGSAVTITSDGVRTSGIITAFSFRPSSGYIQSPNGTNSFYIYDGTGDVAFQGKINTSQINSSSGYKVVDFGSTTTPSLNVANDLNVGAGASIVGVVTASSFSGNATSATTAGYATTSGISTTSQGLSGTPNIVVGIITSNISIPNQLRTKSVSEKTTLVAGNTVSLEFNSGSGNVAICTSPTGDITLNVTGIPTDSSFDNNSISLSVVVNQTGTSRTCTAITLNGVSRTIRWAGGSLANAISGVTTTSGFDIFTFTGINTVGSASTTANYVILGSVSGGFA